MTSDNEDRTVHDFTADGRHFYSCFLIFYRDNFCKNPVAFIVLNTSDFLSVRTPEFVSTSAEGDSASADDDEEAANATVSLGRRRKRKWKRHLTAGAPNYRRLDDDD